MAGSLQSIKNDFVEGLSHISRYWGLPRGVGAIFGVLYLSSGPLSLDELVARTHLTKGAISTNVRALARLGLVHPASRLGDRKDYYVAETDFYRSIRTILGGRQNAEFDRAVRSVRETIRKLEAGRDPADEAERRFLLERIRALQDFFDALDSLAHAVSRLEGLGLPTVRNILKVLK
jgi:DNA-binding transcriptional regulator GbsR (MarR family)